MCHLVIKSHLYFFCGCWAWACKKRAGAREPKWAQTNPEKGGTFFSLSDLMTQCYFFLIWSLCKGKALLHMYLPLKCIPTCFISKYIECSSYHVYCVKNITIAVDICLLVDFGDWNVKEYTLCSMFSDLFTIHWIHHLCIPCITNI